MSDIIKTTIEFNGITMTYPGPGGLIKVSRELDCGVMYNCDYQKSTLVSSDFGKPFYFECTDDYSKLHKFCEMKYLGLVDNPHYKIGDLLREMVKKFDGCLVVSTESQSVLVTQKQLFRLGCSQGVMEVIGCVFAGVKYPSGGGIDDISFNRIDASKIPNVWSWAPAYNKAISSLCEQLKDVEP
jgi:hypothetical protein